MVSERARRELEGPQLPEVLAYLWGGFVELSAARSSTDAGPNPVGWLEIEAWARLTRRSLSAWEVDVLRSLDVVWLTKPDAIRGEA
jgi:hypothetical protein